MLASAFDKIGLSGSICFELTDRAGSKIFDAGLKESLCALDKMPKASNHLIPMVGLHASMTLSDKSLDKIASVFNGRDIGYHFHLAEDKSDQQDSLGKYGMRVAERFAKFGMLGKKSLAIHGVHLAKNEIELLQQSQTNLALCPRSNQNNAVGFAHWWNYNGVKLGFGTDGISSDILGEAQSALYLTRHLTAAPDFGFADILEMLLENNPQIFERITGINTGKIMPGLPADLVLWRYNPPTPLTGKNIWGHYLYGLCGTRADSVWADGRRILNDGKFTNFDYDEILSRARTLAKSLWERI
jgi:cytosine/adenosine deaminase-related metal-dependent hydrolase